MESYKKQVSLRWSDLDPNFHLRHSVYYDFGAQVRIEFLEAVGMGLSYMHQHGFGPILFREECVFKKEIRYPADLFIDVRLKRLRKDHSRFTIVHDITNSEGLVHAVLTVDGSWMDTRLRKLTALPEDARSKIEAFPKTEDFEFYEG